MRKVNLLKFDQYSEAYNALLDGRGVGIAPAVTKGNTSLLNCINAEIEALGKENFFHADYEATLRAVYGPKSDAASLVVEGGKL